MTEEAKQILKDKGRQDLIDIFELNKSGYAGIALGGAIVDRRKFPEATPVKENTLLSIPKPKKV